MTDGTDEEIAVQLAIGLDLPDFEGTKPVGVVTKVNGAGQRIARPLHLEEKVVLVVEASVSNVGHAVTKDGVHRVHTLTVKDLYELEGKAGRRLLTSLREAYRVADDQRHGRKALPAMNGGGARPGPGGWTDEHGHPLDDEALAEIRGEPALAAIEDSSLDPVVLQFADGSRLLWPDDVDGDRSKPPQAGEFVGEKQIRQILDGDTGETLAEWTDEQEDARLAALEAEAQAEEAAEDRAAYEELEAARGRKVGEPWPGYEQSTAKEIRDHVAEMDDRDAVFAVAQWEEEHGGRTTIIEKATKRAAELLEAGE